MDLSDSRPSTPTQMSLDPPRLKRNNSPTPTGPTPPSKRRRTNNSITAEGKAIFHVLLLKTPKDPNGTTDSKSSTTPNKSSSDKTPPDNDDTQVCVISSHGSFHLARDSARDWLVEKCGGDYVMEDFSTPTPSPSSSRATSPLLSLADTNNLDGEGSDMDDDSPKPIQYPRYKDGMEHMFLLTGTDANYKYKLTIQRALLPAQPAPSHTYIVTRTRSNIDEVLLEKVVVAVYGDRERANARARQVLREVEGVNCPGLVGRVTRRRRSSNSVHGTKSGGKVVTRKRSSLGKEEAKKYEESQDSKGYYTGVVYAEQGDRICVKVDGWDVS